MRVRHARDRHFGADQVDADDGIHPGLPWAGCTILSASTEQLAMIREKARASEGVLLADMPNHAQLTRVSAASRSPCDQRRATMTIAPILSR
ncbi:MAG: DUF2000 family protein [Microbacteriaceae bacterium]